MQFKSKNKRSLWLNILIGLIPDIAISMTIIFFANNGNGALGAFFFVFFGLQGIYLLVWIRKSIWNWIYFSWKGRQQIYDAVLQSLKRGKYPEPDDYIDSPQEYYAQVANNEAVESNLRVAAAVEYGAIAAFLSTDQMQHCMRYNLAAENAIIDYKKTFI